MALSPEAVDAAVGSDLDGGVLRWHELAVQRWFNRVFIFANGFPVPVLFTAPMDAFSYFTTLWGTDNNPFSYLLKLKDDKGAPLYEPFPAPPRYPLISVHRKGWAYRSNQNYAYQEFRRVTWPTVHDDVCRGDLATVVTTRMPAAWDFRFQVNHFCLTPQTQSMFVTRLMRRFVLNGGTPQTWIKCAYPGHFGTKLIRAYIDGNIDALTPDETPENQNTEYQTAFTLVVEGYVPDVDYRAVPALWKLKVRDKNLFIDDIETMFSVTVDLRAIEDNPNFHTRLPLPVCVESKVE